MGKALTIVKNRIAQFKFCALDKNDIVIDTAIKELKGSIKSISGADIESCYISQEQLNSLSGLIVLAKYSDFKELDQDFIKDSKELSGSDGFAVREKGGNVYVLSHQSSGVFFGAHDFLEKNADVIWYRGKLDAQSAYIKLKSIVAKRTSYLEKPFMDIREWNMCGIGQEGNHKDLGSVIYYAKNKLNYKAGTYEQEYANYGVKCMGHIIKGTHDLSEFMDTNPEYFMIEESGKPRANRGSYSFMNYYSAQVAKIYAQKIISALELNPQDQNKIFGLDIPDDNFFRMTKGKKVLSDLPFTADDGTVVYPEQKEYKSTVYYNFLNRVVKLVTKRFPDMRFITLAYLYAEECPLIKVDERIIIGVCPISANDHISYNQASSGTDKAIVQNLKKWAGIGNQIAVYAYWGCSCGSAVYPRPICKVVKENLILFKKWGITAVIPEGILDGYPMHNPHLLWASFDMNAIYIWIMNKLFWNPYEDINLLVKKFCKLVYGNAYKPMLKFYSLIQKGWDEQEGYVFCATGNDTYIRQFIINAGIAEKVKRTLKSALGKKLNGEQRRVIEYINNALTTTIDKIQGIKDEQAVANYTELGVDKILSQEQLAVEENGSSVWNSAKKLTSFYDYSKFNAIDEQSKLNVRMLYDNDYIYIGFQVFDDSLSNQPITYNEFNQPTAFRENGIKIDSYSETYIGANILNTSEYFGYITGVFKKHTDLGIYINDGAPKKIARPQGFREGFYFHYDVDPKKRYYFHVQAIAFADLKVNVNDARPFGSFVYYTDRYGRFGWKANGLWAKQGFTEFILKDREN